MAKKGQVGVYALRHKDGGFYIGSSTELHQRFAIHKSRLRSGNNNTKIQEYFNNTGQNIDDWSFEVLETCLPKSLQKKEEYYINKYWNDPNLLNTRKDGIPGKRGVITKTPTRYRIANELLGKNSIDGLIRRPANLTFVAPDGTEYSNIQSVKRFALEHNLLQSSMCQLSNGHLSVVDGWTVKDGRLPDVGHIVDMWSYDRLKKHYKEYEILSPDNTVYKTFYLYGFEIEHDCTVVLNKDRERFISRHTKGLDEQGRGWRQKGTITYRIIWEGQVYENILSVPKWADTHEVRLDRLRNYLLTTPKYKRRFSIEVDS